jgi:hypothetical protein
VANRRRDLGGLLSVLALFVLVGCGEDQSQATTQLEASTSPSVSCKSGQPYQHPTLGYHFCFPSGWVERDYTAEPGSGGAASVLAFGPPASVPAHVPTSGTFIPPIEVRVVSGSIADVEQSLAPGNQLTSATVGGISADRIIVADQGPASGTVIIVFSHEGNAYELEEAPGGVYDAAFQQVLGSFSFSGS